ncbi:MAG: ATP-dependent Clp protease proteolytic subunit [Opitutaceae bacterium]
MRRSLRAAPLALALAYLSLPGPAGWSAEGLEEVIISADAPVSPDAEARQQEAEAAADNLTEPPAPPTSEAEDGKDPELERMRKEREKIAAENALAQEKLRRDLFDLEAEKQRLTLENSLRPARLEAEVAEKRTELDKLALEMEALTRKSALESARRKEELESELAALRAEEERLKLANSIASQKVESRMSEMRLKEAEIKIQKAELEMEVVRLQTELQRREKVEVLRDLVAEVPEHPLEPFADGVLLISDRRIGLNGVIVPHTADLIAERIDYFNNQSTEFPIFLVIDASPGGSVMAGYKILKAMEGSQAPVYVVVKSFAASMAATLTTLAERSFVYPNAVILHHQIAWLGGGNLTQQRELLDEAQQWWRRLAEPAAAKMGLTLDEFIKRMYEENSDGDWREFGDEAVKLKWADEVVHTIWDTSMDKNPDRFGPRPVIRAELEEKTDEAGNPYMLLPRLQAFDHYFLYNRDRYFRLQ